MHQPVKFLLVGTCVLAMMVSAKADFTYEVAVNGGYTDNLLNDATYLDDSYSTTQASVKFYPLSTMEVDLSSGYTYYSKTHQLSNFLYSGDVTFIPIGDESAFSLYLTAGIDRIRYREKFESFDNKNIRLTASGGYVVGPAMRLRAGSKVTATRYVNADSVDADYEQYVLFTGLNLALPGCNSLDVETGWGFTNFTFIDDSLQWFDEFRPGLHGGRFRSFYVSPRFSRPLGLKTGISITYTHRRFTNADRAVVLGYSTGFLSPWASVFDGSSVSAQLKSYLIPRMVVSAGAGYWDKTYLKTMERVFNEAYSGWEWPAPNVVKPRKDYFTRWYFSIQRPVAFGVSGILEPTVTVEYSHNRSSFDTYDYSGTTISAGLVYRR